MKNQHLEIFKNSAQWVAVASGEAELRLSSQRGALRMDFDFKGGRGFVVARRELQCAMPSAFVLRFRLRGRGPVNHFEIKLADESGKNVWRHERKNLHLPSKGREMRVASEEIDFAWGPAGGGEIKNLGAIEFAIVAGAGGAGSVWLGDLRIEDHSISDAPALKFSSAEQKPSSNTDNVSNWQPTATDLRPWLAIDLHEVRLLGGVIIEWQDLAPPSGFRIQGSNNGNRWRTLHTTKRAGGSRGYIYLPKTKTRHLRLELHEPAAVRTFRWQGFEFSRSIEAFWHNIAANEPRGWHPRWLMREQSLWTPTGIPNGSTCALINEEGMVEVDEGSFSIEPFVSVNERLFTWANVKLRQELRDGWMPIPSVIWETTDWRLRIQAFATGDGTLHITQRIDNLTSQALRVRLISALRPFQVTPPWQHYRNVGGVSTIHDLAWRDGGIIVNQKPRIFPNDAGARFGAMNFDDGVLTGELSAGRLPPHGEAHDDLGFASGAFSWEFTLQAGETEQRGWCTAKTTCATRGSAVDLWQHKLPATQLAGTGWAMDVARSALTATAHILVTRSGPALQPGPRRYTRSWIRDGTIMSAALLRMGCAKEVREFIRWYAPFQRDDGFVPYCVDRDGADTLVEHDSHGQFIALIVDYVRFTKDSAFLAEMWPRIRKAAAFIEKSLGADGLMPISASHEGYLAQPLHSYWDDFWTLRGLRDAAALARTDEAAHWQTVADCLSRSIATSIEATRKTRHLDFIPGSAEWADFDPTATANAITLLDVPAEMNRPAVDWTFDKYLSDWRKKRTGELEWSNYTPYEIRIIGAFVRLERRDDALELLRFFLSDRRPLAWNQWPEIAWRDPCAPGHIGDVPHTWIAAEYVLAVRSLFAFETEQTLVLAAGVAPEWMDGDGVRVHEMPTMFGLLSYTLCKQDDGDLWCEIADGLIVPANGIVIRAPMSNDFRVSSVPARVVIPGRKRPTSD